MSHAAKSPQSCPTLCDPIDGSPPGFPSLGFSRQEHWNGLPFPSPVHESEKWKWSCSAMCLTLSDPMDCSLPGYSIHGISQARVLEWGAIHTWWHLVILISGGWKIWEVLCTVGLACRFLIYIYNLPIPVTLFAIFPMLFSYPFVWRAPECQKSNSHFFVVRFPSQVSFLFYFELLLDF